MIIITRKLSEIEKKIKLVAKQLRLDAGYSGLHGDNGASKLLESMEMFKLGVLAGMTATQNNTDLIDVPTQWSGYFITEDPEYQEYLRLKDKFQNR
jgi:hypothetical protein